MTVVIDGTDLQSTSYAEVKIERGELAKEIAALGIYVTGNLSPDHDAAACWALVKELYAEGKGRLQVTMSLTTTDPPADINKIYNLNAASKLAGIPNVMIDDAGECSEIEARQYARRLLQSCIAQAARRTYRCTALLPETLPEKGSVVQMPDGWTGVVLGYRYDVDATGEVLTLDMINYTEVGY